MINGLEIEKVLFHLGKHFECYAIIGGIATGLLLAEKELPFRETRDFDIVLFADGSDASFSEDICSFLRAGKYKNAISNGKKACYRFINPETAGYPKIIELFSQNNNPLLQKHLQKIDIQFDNENLSSIILNEEIVDFIKKRKMKTKEGLPVVDVLGLIALKSHAYFQNLKLYQKKIIDGKENYKKHKNDIIRMLLSLNGNENSIEMPKIIKDDCRLFLDVLKESKSELKSIALGTNIKLEQLVALYSKIFI